ncbi:MAG: amino acid permease [Gemmatimonadota bacterium]
MNSTDSRHATAPDGPPPALRRSIGLLQATALVVGIIIGASIFVQPSEITRDVPSAAGIFMVWAAAGLLTTVGALICAELAAAYPESGGVYVFLRRTLSPAVGFLWGWAMFWSMHSGIIAAIAVIFARYLAWFVPGGDGWVKPMAVGAILLVSAVNYAGVQHGSRLQTAFTIGKVAAIALMIAAGYAVAGAGAGGGGGAATGAGAGGGISGAGAATGASPLGGVTLSAFVRAVGAGLFAFGGWHMVTYTAGETVDAPRTIPRALVLGMGVVIVCYMALNAVYLHVLPLGVVMRSTRVAADAANAVLGSGGAAFMSALVVFSCFGGIAGLVLAGPRVYHAMAEDGLLFRWAGAVHPTFRTPHRAIALQAVWSCVLVATGSYRVLFTRVVYTEWIFFALMAAGLLLARRRPTFRPPYRVRGGVVVPVLFIALAAAVVVNQVVTQPAESTFGLALVLAGLPVYAVWTRRAHRLEERRAHHRLP